MDQRACLSLCASKVYPLSFVLSAYILQLWNTRRENINSPQARPFDVGTWEPSLSTAVSCESKFQWCRLQQRVVVLSWRWVSLIVFVLRKGVLVVDDSSICFCLLFSHFSSTWKNFFYINRSTVSVLLRLWLLCLFRWTCLWLFFTLSRSSISSAAGSVPALSWYNCLTLLCENSWKQYFNLDVQKV